VHHDLEDLDVPFTEEEIESAIKEMPSEKAPSPDGFIGLFLLSTDGKTESHQRGKYSIVA